MAREKKRGCDHLCHEQLCRLDGERHLATPRLPKRCVAALLTRDTTTEIVTRIIFQSALCAKNKVKSRSSSRTTTQHSSSDARDCDLVSSAHRSCTTELWNLRETSSHNTVAPKCELANGELEDKDDDGNPSSSQLSAHRALPCPEHGLWGSGNACCCELLGVAPTVRITLPTLERNCWEATAEITARRVVMFVRTFWVPTQDLISAMQMHHSGAFRAWLE